MPTNKTTRSGEPNTTDSAPARRKRGAPMLVAGIFSAATVLALSVLTSDPPPRNSDDHIATWRPRPVKSFLPASGP
jgi:hypothetical protein